MDTPILILAAIATCAVLYPLHRWLARRSRTTLDIIDSFLSSLLIYGGPTLAVYRDPFSAGLAAAWRFPLPFTTISAG